MRGLARHRAHGPTLAATLHRAATGKAPPEATERQIQDELKPLSEILGEEQHYRAAFLSAIEAGLRLTPSERPQTIEEFSQRLTETEEGSSNFLERFFQKEKMPENRPPRLPDEALSFRPRLRRLAGRSEVPIAGLPPVPTTRRPVSSWFFRIAVAVLALGVGLYGGFEYTRRTPNKRMRLEPETTKLAAEQAEQQKAAARARLEAEEKRFREGAERAFDAMRKAELEVQRDRERRSKPAAFAPPLDRPLTSEEEQRLRGGEVFQECNDCPRMVVVPGGEFMMGSPSHEAERGNDEGPQRKVTIAKPFAVGNFEITFADWDACVATGGCKHKPKADWGRGRQPITGVSWNDTQEYVAWLSRKTSKTYRLLTEAEWEYAARAGTMTPFSTGPAITTDQANFDGNYTYGGSAKGTYLQRTVEVGSFKPNAFGLYDMHGNVWEWVEDCYEWTYAGAPTDGSARVTSVCASRVLRGGSWFSSPKYLRAAVRSGARPDYSTGFYGFRVARTIPMDVQYTRLPEKPQPHEPVPRPQPSPIADSPVPSPAQCDGVETLVGNERRCLVTTDSLYEHPACQAPAAPLSSFLSY
jgi:formylglycine-generating enzyme required for sulfatase activity